MGRRERVIAKPTPPYARYRINGAPKARPKEYSGDTIIQGRPTTMFAGTNLPPFLSGVVSFSLLIEIANDHEPGLHRSFGVAEIWMKFPHLSHQSTDFPSR